ncbi:MAG: hypothetical protein AAGF50_04025 [Pseudomonadota bacterium]
MLTLLTLLALDACLVGLELATFKRLASPSILRPLLIDKPYYSGEIFSSEKWQAAGSCSGLSDGPCAAKEASCPRGPMVRDLLKTHLRKEDATLESVIHILGPKEHDVYIEGRTCSAYSLGMCSGWRFDYDSLYVCFADDGSVSKTGHVQH